MSVFRRAGINADPARTSPAEVIDLS